MATSADLEFFNKDTFDLNVTVNRNGSGMAVTGSTLYFTMKENRDDTDGAAIIQKTGSILDASAGTFLIALDSSNTNVTPGRYFYDLQLNQALNTVTTLTPQNATVLVKQGVTDS